MKKVTVPFNVLCFVFCTFFVSHAHAGFEIRGHYAKWMGTPKDLNDSLDSYGSGGAHIAGPSVLGADALFVMPVLPIAAGLRYETFSETVSGTLLTLPEKLKLDGSRVSLLGGFRLFNNMFFYLGGLAHIGLSQSANVTIDVGGPTKYKCVMDSSYGLGVEAGAYFGGFLLGGEVGYTKFKAKNFTDPTTGQNATDFNGKAFSMDLSGPYVMLSLGYAIF